jgi:hypothetical protein
MERLIQDARGRVQAFLEELARLEEAEFPYDHAKEAAEHLTSLFRLKLARLETLDSKTDPAVVKLQCEQALVALFHAMPLAGFLLRATNVRNAFELYRPLLRLARDVLEPTKALASRQTKLVVASEWDYSPLTLRVPDLPGFVLIGLPAPESANPLLVPLAGHELGHALWAQNDVANALQSVIKKHILDAIKRRWSTYLKAFPGLTITKPTELTTDRLAIESWQAPYRWSLLQAKEIYCDLFGLIVFGTSYLHAFAYLLAPKSGFRSPEYPDRNRRVRHLVTAASDLGIDVPRGYQELFADDTIPGLSPSDNFRVSIADAACDMVVRDLRRRAEAAARQGGVSGRPSTPSRRARRPRRARGRIGSGKQEVRRIAGRLRRVVPAEGCRSLADMMNAAWAVAQEPGLWKEMPELHRKRASILRELVLKNMEIFEIEAILRSGRVISSAQTGTVPPKGMVTP